MGKRLSRPRPWVEPYANNSAEATVASIYIIGGGEELVAEVLAELMARGHDSAALRVLNDGAAAGEFVSVGEARFRIEVASEGAIENAEAAIFLGDGLLAKEFLPMLADRGTLVVDASPYARRMGVGTLVVPEVNGELLGAEERAQLFAFPMPATVGLSIALAPLHAHAAIRRVVTTVFEPASQRGVAGIELLSEQSVAMVSGEGVDREKYPETFAFNVRPQAAGSEGEGWAFDERMISQEIEALFPQPAFDVFTTIARVPVFVGRLNRFGWNSRITYHWRACRRPFGAPRVSCWAAMSFPRLWMKMLEPYSSISRRDLWTWLAPARCMWDACGSIRAVRIVSGCGLPSMISARGSRWE